MYTLLTEVGFRKHVVREGPSLLVSMLVAEIFYKFHSFSLECVAMLATWLVVSSLFSFAHRVARQGMRT